MHIHTLDYIDEKERKTEREREREKESKSKVFEIHSVQE